MKLVEDFRDAWKWISVQANVLNLALLGAWASLPDEMKAGIPQKYVLISAGVLLVLGTIGRLVDQGSK